MRWNRVQKQQPRTLLINYTFDEKEFMHVDTMQMPTTRNKGRSSSWPTNDSEIDSCYMSRLPVSTQKKADLVNLCTKEIIPDEFHTYFVNLPSNTKCKDTVPEHSGDENSEDE